VSASLKNIGALNRRLELEAPVETGDGAGGVVRTYEAVATLWAQVMPVSARSDIAGDHLGAVLRHRIVVRARSGISTLHRLRDGARVFRIMAVRESDGRRFLEIDAEERED
jgi:head-tail adaptor